MAKSKYTAAQRRAYHSGQAYRFGQHGKVIVYKNPKNKESFNAGYRSVEKKVSKAPDRKK